VCYTAGVQHPAHRIPKLLTQRGRHRYACRDPHHRITLRDSRNPPIGLAHPGYAPARLVLTLQRPRLSGPPIDVLPIAPPGVERHSIDIAGKGIDHVGGDIHQEESPGHARSGVRSRRTSFSRPAESSRGAEGATPARIGHPRRGRVSVGCTGGDRRTVLAGRL